MSMMERDPETLVRHIAGTPASWRGEVAPPDHHWFASRRRPKHPLCDRPECPSSQEAPRDPGPVTVYGGNPESLKKLRARHKTLEIHVVEG